MKINLNKKKKILIICIPILIVLIIVGIVLARALKSNDVIENPQYENHENVDYTYAKVFMLSNDNVLVPLTTRFESFKTEGENIFYILSLLKENSSLANSNFKGLLPTDCNVVSVLRNDNTLNVTFDENFKNYEANMELKLLESLVWTLTSIENIEDITLNIDNQLLHKMPVNNTPLRLPLNKNQVGINNYLLTSTHFSLGEKVLSYYEKKIDDSYFYVPVTHYVRNDEKLNEFDLTISTLLKDPGITSSLSVARCLNSAKIVNKSVIKDNVLYVSLTEEILYDETTVSLEVYNLIKESTCLLNGIKDVSFLMELEEVMVNGKDIDGNISVSSVVLNKFYI